MPKTRCACGTVLELAVGEGGIDSKPCFLVSKERIDELADRVMHVLSRESGSAGDLAEAVNDALYFGLSDIGGDMYTCATCGRLLVFWTGSDPRGQFFAPEDTTPKSE